MRPFVGNTIVNRMSFGEGGSVPSNTVAPAISGSTTVGSVLTTTDGTWTGTSPITYTYQWKRGGVAIAGATNNTYITVTADIGENITCEVTATNSFGFASATSNTIVVDTFRLYTNSTSENDINIRTKDGNPTMINWGDGVVEMLPSNVYVTHNYSPNYAGNIIIYNKDNVASIGITKGSWDINLTDLPIGMNNNLFLQGGTSTIIKGGILDIPPNLNNFNINTNGIVYGDLSNISINITGGFYLLGGNHQVTYTAGRVWQNISTALWIRPAVGVFTTTMVDNLLTDLDNSPLFTGPGIVDLRGNCGAASAAAAPAIASLTSKGKTIFVN